MKFFTRHIDAPLRISLLTILILSIFQPAQSQVQVRMRANLMIVNNNVATLMDGNITHYSANYSNAVDGYDIWKMSNFGENFGILRSTANLVIERRNLITINDTTYFRMWNMQARNYRIQLMAENLHQFNLVGFIRDKFLNQDININLNDTTNIDFTVNSQPGSYASNRFQLIYANMPAGTLSVTFVGIEAHRKNRDNLVSWSVANEWLMEKYVVEHATDAVHFTEIKEVLPTNTNIQKTYSITDVQAGAGDHYYRIKAVSKGAKLQYSTIVRISAEGGNNVFNIYPNPVLNKTLQLQMNITLAGTYRISLIQNNGVKQELSVQQLSSGQFKQLVKLPANIAAGTYRLQLTAPDQTVQIKTITVL